MAALPHDGGPGPITVSTLLEAEAFADACYRDIVYAVGIAPHKLAGVTALRHVDSEVELAVLAEVGGLGTDTDLRQIVAVGRW